MNATAKTNQQREGFTLLELLVVVAIIAIIAALSVTVMINIADQASEAATVATIRKIDGLMQKRLEAFDRAFDRSGPFKDRYLLAARNLLAQDRIYGPLRGNRRPGEQDSPVVEILARKVAMRHLFPQRHEDLLLLDFDISGTVSQTDFDATNNIKAVGSRVIDANGNRIADRVESVAADIAKLHAIYAPNGDNGGAYVNDETVSSELMYYFLVHSASLGASDAIADQFTTAEIADTDDDGLLEFVDAWGNPLRFYRWPTRMIDTDPITPFQPILSSLSDGTDVAPIGPRIITTDERLVANILIKGLAPAPTVLPSQGGNVDLNGDGDTIDAGEGLLPRDQLLTDPDDPVGVLYSALEEFDGTVGAPFLAEFNETNYHTPDTYHTMLIVSAGADEELGLFEPSDTANLGNLAAYDSTVTFSTMLERIGDNLTNRNRRAGGRR